MYELVLNCDLCDGDPILRAKMPEHVSPIAWRKKWKRQVQNLGRFVCGCCSSDYRVVDDGIPAESGGLLALQNVSRPRITGVTLASGPLSGGQALVIQGYSFDIGGNLTVKFGGVDVLRISHRTPTNVRVVVPPARVVINALSPSLAKIVATTQSGSLANTVGATTTIDGVSVTVRAVDGSIMWCDVASSDLTRLVDKPFTVVGVTATVKTAARPSLIKGEELIGATSGSRGSIYNLSPLVVSQPTGPFAADEIVFGNASGAAIRLAALPYDGAVDITVANEFGQHETQGTLVKGYTYL